MKEALISKLVRCLWTDCYELFESPDPKNIRICDRCRNKFEKARRQHREIHVGELTDPLEELIQEEEELE